MKAIKLILALLLGALLLIGAVLVAIVTLLDPNDYKDRIQQAALEQADIELSIEGNIAWSLYPWLALELNRVGVRYPDRPALGTLNRAEVAISLPALLGGELQMNRLLVDRLQLNMVQAADGSNNWTPAASVAPRSSSAGTPAADGQDSGDARKPLKLNIEAIEVRDAALTYTDAREDHRVELSELNLTTGQIVIGQAFPLELDATLRQFAGEQLRLHSSASLTTTLTLGLADSHILLEDLSSRLNVLQGAGLPKAITLALDADVDARLNEQQVDVRNLALNLEPVAIAGELQLRNFSQPELSGRLNSNTFNLKQLLTTLGQTVPATADPDALTAVAFEATLGGPAGTLAFKPLNLQLDDTRLDGDASLALASGAIAVTLKGNALDADRYLPPTTATVAADSSKATPPAKASAQGWPKDEILPVAPLRALNLSANLDLGSLKINGIVLGQPGLSVSAANGLVHLTRFSTQAFDGQIQATARLDARQTPVQLHIALQVTQLAMAPLLKTLANNDSLAGTFSARADLNLRGQSVHAWVNSLTGSASLNMSEGLIKGIDAAQSMCQGINNLSALWLNVEQVDKTTPFANLSASFNLRNGMVSNNDLSAKLDAMRVAGSGRINLPTRALDYRIGATIEDNLFNQSCSVNNRLEGVEIPVNCTGSFSDDPAKLCRLDTRFIGDLLKAEARRKVEEKVGTQLEEKLKEKLGEDGAGKVLQGLFGR
ncbi:AsmA family protein [Marinobacterium weihaiense]|uniref:AsmA family protein n=1 Tax=Marinobacterium weihaiense TaxID=2851016 RepID=A0ABS6MDN6_9GAMM|nr:AsmA family protein [Marinobacterium weihaiense]MBV0934419.1 AsmA family protein [Marinobacterium weihaiense]